MNLKIVLILVLVVNVKCGVFNDQLYEEVLDPEECDRQLYFLSNDSLGLRFIDASGKLPPGILGGHLNDMGDYYQCLDIRNTNNGFDIHGKYCTVTIPLSFLNNIKNGFRRDRYPWMGFNYENLSENEKYRFELQKVLLHIAGVQEILSNNRARVAVGSTNGLKLAVCVPKVCTARQALDFFLNRLTFVNVTYTENFCRLPNDKPFVAADYIAIVLLSVITIITIISTSYDLAQIFLLKKHSSQINKLYRSFSIYTNTSRMLTVRPSEASLGCLDGIRVISMMWVIVGHCFVMTLFRQLHNIMDALEWTRKLSSIWLISAPITVDTFFLLSGVLCVYSTIGKIERSSFIRKIHLFYLHRLMRLFPMLAVMVLLQASLVNHMSDGPYWSTMGQATQTCRDNWWPTLLHLQNYLTDGNICLSQTWYLSVDIQLYIICPLVLFWLFGRQKYAWSALIVAVTVSLISASVISFQHNFPSTIMNLSRYHSIKDYFNKYYINTLARAPPFFVGMAYGYILRIWSGKKIRIQKIYCYALWCTSIVMMGSIIYSFHPVMQMDFNNQLVDNLLNSYMRAIWAVALGWVIVACVHGYGGPINWFLSLKMWKIPARLSYAMYLIHFSVMFLANGSAVKTHYFTVGETLHRFISDLSITMLAAFMLCITIDAPFSVLLKCFFEREQKQKRPESLETVVGDKTNDAA